MPPASEYLRSVEWIVVLWVVCAVLLLLFTRAACRAWKRRSLRRLAREETGAAYSMAFVLTFPLFIYLVALLLESSVLLIDKFGTVYATYAAARSAIVYGPQDREQGLFRMRSRARRAAVNAMAPFASSSSLHADGIRSSQRQQAERFAVEARKFAKLQGLDADYFPAKYLYADKAVDVSIDEPPVDQPAGPLRVRLTYLAPTYVPGIGRLLGVRSPNGGRYYVVRMETQVTLPYEGARSADGKLGIDYVSP